MKIEVEKFIANNNTNQDIVIGWCLINLEDKIKIWMKILKGKTKPYAKFPSNKIQENFEPMIVFANADRERDISNTIIPILMEEYLNMPE